MSNPGSETQIHPSAVIESGAEIGKGAKIGPFACVGPNVVVGDRCEIQQNVVLRGHTYLDEGVKVFPFAFVGAEPQHLKYAGEPTRVEVGKNAIIREYATIHRGTPFGNQVTKVGDDAMLMAYVHVSHDSDIGKKAILANSVQMAGHVSIGEYATVGGFTAIAQFCRVGDYCYVGGGSLLRKDLPPYLVGKGPEFAVQGINAVGLTRLGFDKEVLGPLKTAYKTFYLQGLTTSQAIEKLTGQYDTPEVNAFVRFVKDSKMGLVR